MLRNRKSFKRPSVLIFIVDVYLSDILCFLQIGIFVKSDFSVILVFVIFFTFSHIGFGFFMRLASCSVLLFVQFYPCIIILRVKPEAISTIFSTSAGAQVDRISCIVYLFTVDCSHFSKCVQLHASGIGQF
jgi:hypothetical protein